ncbi:MAG TPA: PilN domain-containing protein [Capsulimonadaceae bacterium]|jgi:Tfp pilus assembly protein PilN
MPSINMIAARRAEKRRQERNTQKLIYGIVTELGIILLVTSIMFGRLVTTRNHVQDLNDQIKSLQAKVDEIQHLQDTTASLQPKVATLTQARSNTLYWYTAVQNVSSSLPTDTWLTSMATTGGNSTAGAAPSAGATLNLVGMASSQFVVGATMMRMNTYPTIEQVTLNSVSQSTYGTKQAVSFNLVVQLKPAATATPAVGGANVSKS